MMATPQIQAPVKAPRIAITFCTQCRWMLRAAYFAQELLSTFNTSIGEVALIPATGGLFTVVLTHVPVVSAEGSAEGVVKTEEVLIWDRKAEGGFPETKILKQRIRNYIEPDRNLGHSDTPSAKTVSSQDGLQKPTAAETASIKKSDQSVDSPAPVTGKDQTCQDCV